MEPAEANGTESISLRPAVLAGTLTAALVWAFYAALVTRYYDFDSVPMIITDRSTFNPAHFGYQEMLLLFSRIFHLIGIESISRYHFLQIVQAGLAATVFGVIVYALARQGRSIAFAVAITLFLAMSGASIRMTTMLEDDVLTPLSIILGIIFMERKQSGPAVRYIAPALLWLCAMSFDMVAASATGPLFLLLFYRLIRERRYFHFGAVFLMGLALGGLFLLVKSNTQDSYESMRWGGHYLSVTNLTAFAVSGGRLLLYLVGPSMNLLGSFAAKAAAGAVILCSAGFFAALTAWAFAAAVKNREHGGLIAAVLSGAVIRVVFAFWWMPWNSEQLITPWYLAVFTAGLIAAGSDRGLLSRRAVWTAAATAVMLAGNLFFVALPAHRYDFQMIEAVKDAAESEPGLKVSAILTDAQDLAAFYWYREAFVPPASQADYPEVAVYYFSLGVHRLPTASESADFEKAVTNLTEKLIARDGRTFFLTAEAMTRANQIETDSSKRDPSAETGLASMSLGAVLSRHFQLSSPREIRGYRFMTVTAKPSGD